MSTTKALPELPPLPEPAVYDNGPDILGEGIGQYGFSAEQVHAYAIDYARAALAAAPAGGVEPTEEMLIAGQEALFEEAPHWTIEEREQLAVAVFKAMNAAATTAQPQPTHAAILEALENYRVSSHISATGDALGLADVLKEPGAADISTGTLEVQMLADAIYSDLEAARVSQPEAPAEPSVLATLPTYRPVWLQFDVAMHKDVRIEESGWLRRSDVLSSLTTPAPAARQPAELTELRDESIITATAWALAVQDGVDDPEHLIWEGGPTPEPWGPVYERYRPQAIEIIEAILKAQGGSQ